MAACWLSNLPISLGDKPIPVADDLLGHISVFSTPTETLCNDSAEGSFVTVAEREYIIWCDHKFQQSQFAETLGHDDIWLDANTNINGFRRVSSTQFHLKGLPQAAISFSGTSQLLPDIFKEQTFGE